MSKTLVLGNGNILVGLDKSARTCDFYFPHIGSENHAGLACSHRVGIFIDGHISWIEQGAWNISIDYRHETLVSNIRAVNDHLGIEVEFFDAVHYEKDIFLRKVTIKNMRGDGGERRACKVFFVQQFQSSEGERGYTAYFDPDQNAVVHYKGKRAFFVGGIDDAGALFEDWSVGLFRLEGKEGTWKDAEDGELAKNPVEHGSVDSAIGFTVSIAGGERAGVYYFVSAGRSVKEAKALHALVQEKTPAVLLDSTDGFWRAWVNKSAFTFHGLSDDTITLFKKSLLIVRTHVDNHGGIIASGDSDLLKNERDSYGYVWPRDAAFIAIALDKAGYAQLTRKLFEFFGDLLEDDGYFLHKYRVDGSLGSSWHPWLRNGEKTLPIQEDETALIIYALWEHYRLSRDIEFMGSLYYPFIRKAAEFLVRYRDQKTGLPLGSYDLWEEKWGTSTFTAASVSAGLVAAAKFARLFGKQTDEERYERAAREVKDAVIEHLYDDRLGFFKKLVEVKDGEIVRTDDTLDMSSFFAAWRFGILEAGDPRLEKSFETVDNMLCCKTPIGGAGRYLNDNYRRSGPDIPGNPWYITTLWIARYHIWRAKNESDLDEAKRWIKWVVDHALSSGILSEQLNPFTGEQLSAAPLTWSHAEFATTIVEYLEKLEELGICKVCNPIK